MYKNFKKKLWRQRDKAHGTPEKHVSLMALKALGAIRTTSPLVRQCQEVLNDISAWYAVDIGSLGM
jgi:hypothetical protein